MKQINKIKKQIHYFFIIFFRGRQNPILLTIAGIKSAEILNALFSSLHKWMSEKLQETHTLWH